MSVTVGVDERDKYVRITILLKLWNALRSKRNWTWQKTIHLSSPFLLLLLSFVSSLVRTNRGEQKPTFPPIGRRCLAASSYRSRAWATNQIYVHNVGHKVGRVERSSSNISPWIYILFCFSCCLIGDPGLRAARISKPAIRFLREGWKGIGRNFIYSGGEGSKNSNRSVDSVIHRDRGGGGGRWASE